MAPGDAVRENLAKSHEEPMTKRPPARWSVDRRLRTWQLTSLPAVIMLLAACSSGAASPIASQTPTEATVSPAPTASPAPTIAVTVAPTTSPAPTTAVVTITPIPGAPDSGVVVELSSKTDLWSVKHLDAPAEKGWHVKIDAADRGTHNFTVASGPTVPERIFQSPRYDEMGIVTFDIPALPAGSYLFICTLHPERMTGTLTIAG